jgi:hypothetical protein
MKLHIAGLSEHNHSGQLEGLFLVQVERGVYRWHAQKSFFLLYFVVLEPKESEGLRFSGRLYSTPRALWRLHWFLRDFGYDRELIEHDAVDEKALAGLRGIVRTSRCAQNGHSFVNLGGFAPAAQWEELSAAVVKPSGDLK